LITRVPSTSDVRDYSVWSRTMFGTGTP
jgi:hypothetical protein